MNRSELTNGLKVLLHGSIEAKVIRAESNGVKVGFWGMGLKAGQWVEKRVSLRDLSPFQAVAA